MQQSLLLSKRQLDDHMQGVLRCMIDGSMSAACTYDRSWWASARNPAQMLFQPNRKGARLTWEAIFNGRQIWLRHTAAAHL